MKTLILVEHSEVARDVLPSIIQMGYEVLYLGSSLALQGLCSRFIPIDPVTRTAELLKQHGEELRAARAAGVFSFLEHGKPAEWEIADFLGLPRVSRETLRLSRDKNLMRLRLHETDLRTIATRFIATSDLDPAPPFTFPFIVKPNLGYASAGVQLVRDPNEFAAAVKVVRRLNHFVLGTHAVSEAGVLCEEFIDGPEFSIDSLTVDGLTRVFCVCGRKFLAEDNFQDYVYYSPPILPSGQLLNDLEHLVGKLLQAIGYIQGPSHTEVRYDLSRRRWCVLESGLRVGFAGNIGVMYGAISGLEYNGLAVRAALGDLTRLELETLEPPLAKFGVVFTPATGKGGIVREVRGEDELRADPRIISLNLAKHKCDLVIPYPRGLEYLGSVIGVADTRGGLDRLIQDLTQGLEFFYEE